ncbi:MAG: hypothetical protein P8X67_19330, partial [Syntrophobacterales bacterium]
QALRLDRGTRLAVYVIFAGRMYSQTLRCLARIFYEFLSRDRETGNPLAGLSGAQRARRGWACHLATTGCWFRGVPERYVAGADTRGRQEGRPYPWSQQVIHEISGLRIARLSIHEFC